MAQDFPITDQLDLRRILIFLGIAFGLAWFTGLVIYLTGGLVDNQQLNPLLLLTTSYMWAPAIAHIITRLITREGWQDPWLKPYFRRGWPFWLTAWFFPAILTILGAVIYFSLFPRFYDANLENIRQLMESSPQPIPFDPWTFTAIQTLSAVVIAPMLNGLFTLGEEFGWRGYLLQKMLPLGGRQATLVVGIIWGVWHWPVIAMGYNYGFGYLGAPWTGMLMMIWFTMVTGAFLAWVTLRGWSIWPAVIGHAAINGIGPLALLLLQGEPNMLLGPLPLGLIASLPWAIFALFIFLVPGVLRRPEEQHEIQLKEELEPRV